MQDRETVTRFMECYGQFEQTARNMHSLSPFGIRMVDRLTGKPFHLDISDLPMKNGTITNRNKFQGKLYPELCHKKKMTASLETIGHLLRWCRDDRVRTDDLFNVTEAL